MNMNLNYVYVEFQMKIDLTNFHFFLKLAEQRKSTIDEMAANSLQVEEKNKTFMKNLKEKYENDISKFEQENTDLKVNRFSSMKNSIEEYLYLESKPIIKTISDTLYESRKST